MSATRDTTQKFTFVYSNLYQIYRKGKEAATSAPIPPAMSAEKLKSLGVQSGRVIKADDFNSSQNVHVVRHEPPRFLAKRLETHRASSKTTLHPQRKEAIDGLRDNLKTLKGLHERLRFMLKELEELTQNSD